MVTLLNFSELGCLNESAAGSMGAGMASFVRGGFPAVRGFVVTPLVFSDFLKKDEIITALELFSSGAEDPDEAWRTVKTVFTRSRLNWNHEMEVLSAFGELGSTVSIATTSRFGANLSPVYASRGEDVLDGIKYCWLKWLKASMQKLKEQDLPAVLVRELIDSEVSVELRKKGDVLKARAVFGLPEGLYDSSISSDIFEFTSENKLDRMEMRQQDFQYVMKEHGPSRVSLDPDLKDDEKLSGEMLTSLEGLMTFMRENSGIEACGISFVNTKPVIFSAVLISDSGAKPEIPPREMSMSLLEPIKGVPQTVLSQGPVVATRIFLYIENIAEASKVQETYLDGCIAAGNILAMDGWKAEISALVTESKRRFRTSSIIIELGNTHPGTLERLVESAKIISENSMQPGILIPGIRSADELAKAVRTIKSAIGDSLAPIIWVRVMYPSNLFFMESLARNADILALDLESLGRLMLGGTEDGKWLPYSIQALEKALELPLQDHVGQIAILSEDIVSTPSLLEFLVRGGTEIICVRPAELGTVKHIVASVEKRMLLEQGRE
ncbi:MAG: hypothetical protein Q7J68_01140 [Thermoplasmata archaeon]|nr:hypothetical protein [Thermoplasmata archaeon]